MGRKVAQDAEFGFAQVFAGHPHKAEIQYIEGGEAQETFCSMGGAGGKREAL